jgi:uncharacterized protein HemX
MDALKQARRDAVAAFMLVIFFVLVIACLSFADDGQHPNVHASQGIDSIYALISSLVVGAGVLVREFLTRKTHQKSEELNEAITENMGKIDRKFDKLFQYSDDAKNNLAGLHGRVSTLEQQVRSIDSMQQDIKEMTKEMKQIQINIERLITVQEAYIRSRSKNG